MTRRGSTRDRRTKTGCSDINPITMGGSPRQSTQTSDSFIFKTSMTSPGRRQSPRLKAINAIYDAEDVISSKVQQTSVGNSHNSGQIEVKSIVPPDDPSIDEPLKNLRKRCKSKMQKHREPVTSSATGFDHTLVKQKEEELDLDEPLICLKIKLPNKSCVSRKRRKHGHLSEPVLPAEGTAKTNSFSREESSSPVKTDSSSLLVNFSPTTEVLLQDKLADESLEVTSDKDPHHFGNSKLSYSIKSEIVETYETISFSSVFTDNCLGGSSINQPQKFCEEKSADSESSYSTMNLLHPCVDYTEVTTHSSFSVRSSNLEASLHLVGISQSVDEVTSELVESDSLGSNCATYASDSFDVDVIGRFNNPSNSSSELVEKIDKGEEHDKLNSSATKQQDFSTNKVPSELMELDNYISNSESNDEPLDYCVNKVSVEFSDADNNTSLPESDRESCGEEQFSSERSTHKVSSTYSKCGPQTLYADTSQWASATADLSSVVSNRERNLNTTLGKGSHYGLITQIDNLSLMDDQECSPENDSVESRVSQRFKSKGDELPAPDLPICINENSVTSEHGLMSGDARSVPHASGFSGEAGSLDSLVLKALCGDAWQNTDEYHVSSNMKRNSLRAHNLYDIRHSNTSVSTCSGHASLVSLTEAERLHCSTIYPTSKPSPENASSSPETDAGFIANSQIKNKSSGYGPCVSDSDTSSNDAQDLCAESSQCSTPNQMLNSLTEKAADFSTEELIKACCHSPHVSLPSSISAEYSLPEATKGVQSSSEKMSHIPVDVPTCLFPSLSNIVEGGQSNMKNELKCNQSMLKNLLSNKKVFSPTSLEKAKLRQALDDNRLDYMMQTADNEEAKVMLSSERITKRSKGSKKGSPQQLSKGILKSLDASERNCSCPSNSLIHTQAEKAVAFSQRQMQDIENIAAKLLKGLTSMKTIMADSLGSESCPFILSKFTPEEIKTAIDNASNLESTTKKWLSMMTKDCNRFCKIMKSTENKGASPLAARKQQKKIKFADEAGGLLCDVKVFEQIPACFVAPRSEGSHSG